MGEPVYMTLEELATRWHCHKDTAMRRARRHLRTAILRFPGGQTLIDRNAVLKLEREQRGCGKLDLPD